jgi:NADH dehydrogenase
MPLLESRVAFLTGTTGFVGRSVLERLRSSSLHELVCLVRHAAPVSPPRHDGPMVTYVRGDLADPDSYASALARADTVVHLAAAVGGASDAELERVNVAGTRELVTAAKRAGVSQILFMSSIAAKTRDVMRYPYARTKLEGERCVAQAGLRHAILRPTIVLGEGGGNFSVLRKLASLPMVPAFGGGTARVQPVAVTDVARAVELLLTGRAVGDSLIELGGPEILTFAELLLRIRRAAGRRGGLLLPVPYEPARVVLAILATLSGGRFPVRPAQLTPFVSDGVAAASAVSAQLAPMMEPLMTVLERLARAA